VSITAGIDVGSTYTKAVVVDGDDNVLGRSMRRTGFRLAEVSRTVYDEALAAAGLRGDQVAYVVSTVGW